MKERPILFSGPMVMATLRDVDPKTQTRRPMRIQPSGETTVHVEHFNQTVIDRWGDEQPGPEIFGAWWDDGECGLRCPYGQPGDRLWVREAWRTTGDDGRCDDMPPRDLQPHEVWYEASGPAPASECTGRLRPSMFMPRWASRIQLEVTGIRVERLQDISMHDVAAEGVESRHVTGRGTVWGSNFGHWNGAYADLWESINGEGSWALNPWVWVIEFRRANP